MSTGVERLELQSLKFAKMLSPLMLRLELQNMKVAKMLSPLMLRLELQNMKISHYILSSNLYY